MPRRLRNSARAGAALLLLAGIGAELGLRRAGYGQVTPMRLDERLGWVRYPGQERETRRGVPVSINSQGYRDREWAPPGDAAAGERALRVAVIGDSVSAGGGVAVEQTWARRVEERLRVEAAPRELLVMNYSVAGYGMEQMARVYEDHARPYRPDVVVLCVHAWSLLPMRPTRSERDWPLKRQLVSTALYDWYQREVRGVHGPGDLGDEAALPAELRERADAYRGAEGTIRAAPFSPEAEPLWAAALERLRGLEADLAARGGRLVLLCMPRLRELRSERGEADLERWRGFARRLDDAPCIDPRAALAAAMEGLVRELSRRELAVEAVWQRDEARRTAQDLEHAGQAVFFLHDPEHLTPRGHEVVAGVVEPELARLLELD